MRTTAKQNYPDSIASYDTRPGNETANSTMLLGPHVLWERQLEETAVLNIN